MKKFVEILEEVKKQVKQSGRQRVTRKNWLIVI